MNEGSEKKFWIIVTIIIIIVGFLAYKYVIMYDTSGNSSGSSHVQRNEEPALTLKSDKEAQAQKEKKAEDNDDKDKDKADDKKDDGDKSENIKSLKSQAKENAVTVLDIQSKPKDEFKSESTQARFKEAATTKFVKTHQDNNNKDDKTIRYKNVELKIDDEKDFEKDTVKGELKFDRLINPKGKDSKVEASTAVDSKLSVIFKKEDNKFKVSQLQM